MKIYFGLIVAALIGFGASAPAEAATCDATKSKFTWRRCMSKEVDRLRDELARRRWISAAARSSPKALPPSMNGWPAEFKNWTERCKE